MIKSNLFFVYGDPLEGTKPNQEHYITKKPHKLGALRLGILIMFHHFGNGD